MLYPLSYEGLRGATLPGERGPLEPGAAECAGAGPTAAGRVRRGSGGRPSPPRVRRPAERAGATSGPAQARPHGMPLLRSDDEASSRLRAGTTMTGQAAWDRTPWLVEPSSRPVPFWWKRLPRR